MVTTTDDYSDGMEDLENYSEDMEEVEEYLEDVYEGENLDKAVEELSSGAESFGDALRNIYGMAGNAESAVGNTFKSGYLAARGLYRAAVSAPVNLGRDGRDKLADLITSVDLEEVDGYLNDDRDSFYETVKNSVGDIGGSGKSVGKAVANTYGVVKNGAKSGLNLGSAVYNVAKATKDIGVDLGKRISNHYLGPGEDVDIEHV